MVQKPGLAVVTGTVAMRSLARRHFTDAIGLLGTTHEASEQAGHPRRRLSRILRRGQSVTVRA